MNPRVFLSPTIVVSCLILILTGCATVQNRYEKEANKLSTLSGVELFEPVVMLTKYQVESGNPLSEYDEPVTMYEKSEDELKEMIKDYGESVNVATGKITNSLDQESSRKSAMNTALAEAKIYKEKLEPLKIVSKESATAKQEATERFEEAKLNLLLANAKLRSDGTDDESAKQGVAEAKKKLETAKSERFEKEKIVKEDRDKFQKATQDARVAKESAEKEKDLYDVAKLALLKARTNHASFDAILKTVQLELLNRELVLAKEKVIEKEQAFDETETEWVQATGSKKQKATKKKNLAVQELSDAKTEHDVVEAGVEKAKDATRAAAGAEARARIAEAVGLASSEETVEKEAEEREPSTFIETTLNLMPFKSTASLFGKHFAAAFYACKIQFTNTQDKDLLLYGASLENWVEYRMSVADVEKYFGYDSKKNNNPTKLLEALKKAGEKVGEYGSEYPAWSGHLDWGESRRPMSFADILAIFERNRRGNFKQRAIDKLQFVGALATGSSVFVTRRDYDKGVALFTGIFTPQLEELILWDILLNLQNIQSRTLKEIEEIQPYGQLDRVVFYPRGPIHGLVRGVPVYIAEISGGKATAAALAIDRLGADDDSVEKARVAKIKAAVAASATTALETAADSELAEAAITYLQALQKKEKEKAEQAIENIGSEDNNSSGS